MQLRRWWSRRYGRPPNDPLFGDQTQTFWLTEFYRDCLEEAYALKDQIEQMPSGSGSKGALAVKNRMLGRFRALQAILKGESASPADDRLACDIEAQRRGELPDFVRRKMQQSGGQSPAGDGLQRVHMPELMRQKMRRQKPAKGAK